MAATSTRSRSSSVIEDNFTITGKVRHTDEAKSPVNGRTVTLYKTTRSFKTLFFKSRKDIATVTTDTNGQYTFNVDPRTSSIKKTSNLFIDVIEKTHVGSKHSKETKVVGTLKVDLNNIQNNIAKQEKLKIDLYEAASGSLGLMKDPQDSNRRLEEADLDKLGGIIGPTVVNKFKEFFTNCFKKSTAEVQAIFNPASKLQLTEEHTLDILYKGIYQGRFRKAQGEDGLLVNIISWDGLAFDTDAAHANIDLPNMKLYVSKQGDGLQIERVHFQERGQPEEIIRRGEEKFNANLFYKINSLMILRGEAECHLAKGHLVIGAITRAIQEFLVNHPLRTLLEPHLEFNLMINKVGNGLIFGDSGVLNLSKLSGDGVTQLLKSIIASESYRHFDVRDPVCKKHAFAKAMKLYWEAIKQAVDQYYEANADAINSTNAQAEMKLFSDELVRNCPEYQPYEAANDVYGEWLEGDRKEIDLTGVEGRERVKDKYRSMHPVNSIEDQKKLACYFLYYIIYHSNIHQSQVDTVRDIRFASLAPRNGAEGEFGGTEAEDAAHQLTVASILTEAERPKLIDNPDGSIYGPLIENIMKHASKLRKYGFPPENIFKSVSI